MVVLPVAVISSKKELKEIVCIQLELDVTHSLLLLIRPT